MRIEAERGGGTHTIDVVGALHGELQPLVPLDALVPLDDLARRLTGRGIPDPLLTLGKFGTAHQLYIPWMQASYIMVANKAALPYLPERGGHQRAQLRGARCLGQHASSRRPASACSAFRRGRKG